jgi:hypothetical protein
VHIHIARHGAPPRPDPDDPDYLTIPITTVNARGSGNSDSRDEPRTRLESEAECAPPAAGATDGRAVRGAWCAGRVVSEQDRRALAATSPTLVLSIAGVPPLPGVRPAAWPGFPGVDSRSAVPDAGQVVRSQ